MKFSVGGMSCASCASNVDKTVRSLKNVEDCSVNLLTGMLIISGNPDENEVINAVKKLGFTINRVSETNSENRGNNVETKDKVSKKNTDTSPYSKDVVVLIKRLVLSFIFWVPLMYYSMIHMLFNLSLGSFFQNNPIAVGLLQCILCLMIIIINKDVITHGVSAVFRRIPNMDTLVALGVITSFVYSLCMLFSMTAAPEEQRMHIMMNNLYFEGSGTILLLISIGRLLDAISKGKTTSALNDLKKLYSETVTIIQNGEEKTVSISSAKVGDMFIVRPGESIPLDGVITSGSAAVNEASLTGESVPKDKKEGDEIYQGTILVDGCIVCQATKIGSDTALAKIINMVENASSTSIPIAKTVDKVARVFIPAVIIIAFITFIGQMILNASLSYAIVRAVSVLVVSCPCALGLATPLAIMVSTGRAAKKGILFKNAAVIENACKVKTIVLDKTGKITKGEMIVSDILPYNSEEYDDFVKYAYSLEYNSKHPISVAIVNKFKQLDVKTLSVSDFYTLAGKGVAGFVNNEEIVAGNVEFISEKISVPAHIMTEAQKLKNEGKTVVMFAYKKAYFGMIALYDEIRSESIKAIENLKKMGIKIVMLTGDNEQAAARIASITKVDKTISQLLPHQKAEIVKSLAKEGPVMMVGDGINDAVALESASVGVAIKSGSSLAVNSSDVVLMNSSLMSLEQLISISRRTLRRIKQNLFWAFLYNIICIPLAAGIFAPVVALSPELSALGMGLSSVIVSLNSLR